MKHLSTLLILLVLAVTPALAQVTTANLSGPLLSDPNVVAAELAATEAALADHPNIMPATNVAEYQYAQAAPSTPVVAEAPVTTEPVATSAPAGSEPIAAPAAEDESPKTLLGDTLKDLEVTGSATLDYYDKYVWRGQYLDHDGVLQPGVSFSSKGFTLGYWGSFDMENTDLLTSDESDFYLSYSYTFDSITATIGHTWYAFPEYNTSSKEIFASLSFANIPFSPVISFMHDYEDGKDLNSDGDGNYYSLSLSKSIPVMMSPAISLELGMTLGYVDGQWLSGEGAHFTPTAGLKIPVTKNLSITPTIGYNAPMGDLEDPDIGNQPDKVFGGIKTAFAF